MPEEELSANESETAMPNGPPTTPQKKRKSRGSGQQSSAAQNQESTNGTDLEAGEIAAEASGENASSNLEDELAGQVQSSASEEPPLSELEGVRLRQVIEALLFASSEPLSIRRLNRMLKEAKRAEIESQLLVLEGELATDDSRGYSLTQDAGGYRLLTRAELAPYVARLRGERKRIRLSKAAFEALAIIAYRQPIRRSDLDSGRGVQSGAIVKNLMEWNLVSVAGRDEAIGRALLYGTTEEFLDQFGLSSLEELPDPAVFMELGSSTGVVVPESDVTVTPTGVGVGADLELSHDSEAPPGETEDGATEESGPPVVKSEEPSSSD